MENEKIAVLGAGNLGISIARGVVEKKLTEASNIWLTKRNLDDLEKYQSLGFQVTKDNALAVKQCKWLILCVQPKQLEVLMDEIKSELHDGHVIVSTLTGVSITRIREKLPVQIPVIRAMPNTAIAIGESMTCMAADADANGHLNQVEQLFGTLGKTLWIEENLMQAATVLGASGIAFFMRYLRAATQGGVQMGFDSADAQLIAMQTAKGAASLILEMGTHPEMEIDKVTTPMGCTIEGLNEMEHQGFSSALIKGIMTSYHRITDMKK